MQFSLSRAEGLGRDILKRPCLSVYRSVSLLSIRHVSFSHYSLKTYWGISTKLVHLWRHKTFLHTKRNKKTVAKRPPKSQRNHCKTSPQIAKKSLQNVPPSQNVPPNRKKMSLQYAPPPPIDTMKSQNVHHITRDNTV